MTTRTTDLTSHHIRTATQIIEAVSRDIGTCGECAGPGMCRTHVNALANARMHMHLAGLDQDGWPVGRYDWAAVVTWSVAVVLLVLFWAAVYGVLGWVL